MWVAGILAGRSWFLVFACAVVLAGAEIEGVVLENLSGRPLARTRISLEIIQGGGASQHASLLSDSQGRFVFRSLAAGAYLLSARRAGYLTARYGQRRWDGAGAPIVLDGDAHYFAEIRLQRLGVIAGHVLDENQVGLPGYAVYALQGAERPLRVAATAITDDRGAFRLVGLEPGAYYVRTGPKQLEDGRGLLPTFYGQTTAVAQARLVAAELDRETGGIDIEPLPGRLARLAGRVVGGLASVTLFSEMGQRELQVGLDGRFQFEELAPGPYQLLAVSSHRPLRAAWQRVNLGEAGAEVTLELARLPELRVRCEAKDGQPVEPSRITVFLRRNEPPGSEPIRLEGGQSAALIPGEYEAVALATPEYYIAGVRVPQRGSAPARLQALPGDSIELTVVVGSRPAGISGTILDAEDHPVAGATVFLRPADPYLDVLLEGGRSVRSDQHGRYRFDGLPPGRYRLLASFEIARPRERDWDLPGVGWLTLEEGRRATLDLKLIGGL